MPVESGEAVIVPSTDGARPMCMVSGVALTTHRIIAKSVSESHE